MIDDSTKETKRKGVKYKSQQLCMARGLAEVDI